MATASGEPGAALNLALVKNSHEFDFFQAVRLCLRIRPDCFAPGQFVLPSREAVRFHQLNSFTFPPAVVYSLLERQNSRRDVDSWPFDMTLTVLGLTGYSGLLPWFYTKLLIQEQSRTQDTRPNRAFAAFLDLFNHRLVSLQYCAWEKHRPYVSYERNPSDLCRAHSLTSFLSGFLGLTQQSVRERLQVSDSVLLGYVGFLSSIPRSLAGLKCLLARFRVPANVSQFKGRWSRLRSSELAVLGNRNDSIHLGEGATLGRSIWYAQASFRIQLGPLSLRDFNSFQPGTARFGELVDLVNYFTRGLYEEFKVELLLRKEDVPFCYLKKNTFGTAVRLGRNGWLGEDCKNRRHRTDKPVIFRSGDARTILRAAIDQILKALRQALMQERKIELEWSDEIVQVYSEQFIHFSGSLDVNSQRSKDILALLINERIELAIQHVQSTGNGQQKFVLKTAVQ